MYEMSAQVFKTWFNRFGTTSSLDEALDSFGASRIKNGEELYIKFPDNSRVSVLGNRCTILRGEV